MDCKKCGKELYEMGCQLGVEMCDCPPAQMTAPRVWTLLGVAAGQADDLTTEVYLQGGCPFKIGERITVVEKSALDAALKEVATLKSKLGIAEKTAKNLTDANLHAVGSRDKSHEIIKNLQAEVERWRSGCHDKEWRELQAEVKRSQERARLNMQAAEALEKEVERFKLLHDEEKSLRGMIEIERDEHFAKLAAAEASLKGKTEAHENLARSHANLLSQCEDWNSRWNALREQLAAAEAEITALKEDKLEIILARDNNDRANEDEIHALREENARLKADLQHSKFKCVTQERLEQMQAKLTRAVEALGEIYSAGFNSPVNAETTQKLLSFVQALAKKTLKEIDSDSLLESSGERGATLSSDEREGEG